MPVAFETSGVTGPQSRLFLKELGHCIKLVYIYIYIYGALASPRFRVSDSQISARSSKNRAQGAQSTPAFLWRNARAVAQCAAALTGHYSLVFSRDECNRTACACGSAIERERCPR